MHPVDALLNNYCIITGHDTAGRPACPAVNSSDTWHSESWRS